MQNSYFSCMNIHEYDMKMMCEIIYILIIKKSTNHCQTKSLENQ